jgi:hypothetical protein
MQKRIAFRKVAQPSCHLLELSAAAKGDTSKETKLGSLQVSPKKLYKKIRAFFEQTSYIEYETNLFIERDQMGS